jgi:peptide/nickel transport system ATP-binding protein/oligopeptide transport system ATP-binding protein
MEVLIETRDLQKEYSLPGKKTLRAVDQVSLQIHRGEILGLVGESGCGKSTLGRLLMRLIAPTSGSIFFGGEDLSLKGTKELLQLRRKVQMVFQDPYGSFNPKMRLGKALTEVGTYYGLGKEGTQARITELLDLIGLSEDTLTRVPNELSGGQLQRLAIARALIPDPEFIVADEPVSALDVSVQAQLLNLLSDLRQSISLTMLFISHDISVVEYLCDRVAVMYLGTIVETANTGELFFEALHPYTRVLIASAPTLSGTPAQALTGEQPNQDEEIAGCRFYARCRSSTEICKTTPPQLTEISSGHHVACHMCKTDASYKI